MVLSARSGKLAARIAKLALQNKILITLVQMQAVF